MTDFDPGQFSNDYFVCRDNFKSIAKRLGTTTQVYSNPTLGPGDATLTTDTALVGPADAPNLVILISGTHGLESFAGSGVQVALLNQFDWNKLDDTCVLFVHVLNPWGAAYLRRQNEENVDVNRNFRAHVGAQFENRYYDLLHPIIHKQNLYIGKKRNIAINRDVSKFRQTYGETAFNSALFMGQTRYPDGIGYCGIAPTWSNKTIQYICEKFGDGRKRVAIVDVHTGLGEHGHGSVLFTQPYSGAEKEIAQRWFGSDFIAVHTDESFPYVPDGDMVSALPGFFSPGVETVSVALEFGTFDVEALMQGQIDDSWLNRFGTKDCEIRQSIKRGLVEFFCPDSGEWRQKVTSRTFDVLSHLLAEIQR